MKDILISIIITILVSAFTAYLVASNQSNIRFVFVPRVDNRDYGYLEIDGEDYRQLYTTTQVNFGNGLHYHRIDLRTK